MIRSLFASLLVITLAPAVAAQEREWEPAPVLALESAPGQIVPEESVLPDSLSLGHLAPPSIFRSEADSIEYETFRGAAERARGIRVVISRFDRALWVVRDDDTLHFASAAVGMDSTLVHGASEWNFETPRGIRRVLGKQANPVWVPPDWHYVEVAAQYGLQLERLNARRPVELSDGRKLVIRRDEVGVLDVDGTFTALPHDEQIVFDGTLYMPPFGTRNRRIEGELGAYRLDLGNGYLIHGTPHLDSIGSAATHGCVRLSDEDIEWLFRNVPTGTRVFVY